MDEDSIIFTVGLDKGDGAAWSRCRDESKAECEGGRSMRISEQTRV